MCYGFLSSYTSWILHGEEIHIIENARVPSDIARVQLDSTSNLLDDLFPDINMNMQGEYGNDSSEQPMNTDIPSTAGETKTQEPEDLPHLEAEYNMPPTLAPECKSFKWKIEVIDINGNIEGKMVTSKDIWKLQNSRVIVHFDETSGQPIGESGGLLGSWLGQLSNDVNLLPINYSDWRLVNIHIKNKVWEVIQSKFWFDDPTMRKVYVMGALGSRCKDVRLRLWKEYKRDNLSDMLQNRPEHIPENQWGHFVHMRFTEKWKKIKTGKTPSRAEFFIETRTKPNGSFVSEEAKTRVEALTILLSQNPHATNHAPASLDDVYAQVFGPERPGRVRCLGRGPTPSKLVRRSTARAWAASFAVAFANIPNPTFANMPTPQNPD
ncbi:hypothetical protein HID58_092849, partial [Brassica napus]